MKVIEAIELINKFRRNTRTSELLKKIQGDKIYKCPKCGGSGKIKKIKNLPPGWGCCEELVSTMVNCDLSFGKGYISHEYKPKMVEDGWES